MQTKIIFIILIMVSIINICFILKQNTKKPENKTNWSLYTKQYRNNDKVNQLILVKYLENSNAEVLLYTKDKTQNNAWTLVIKTDAFVGRDGITSNKHESDYKTPIGDFEVLNAFGIKHNPNTALPYIDITDTIFACDDNSQYYNQIIDTNKTHYVCSGEHMIDYSPEYNYGFAINYNPKNEYPKGSAIFFHTKGAKNYTGGCIAVNEDQIIKILQTIEKGARIIINFK